MSPSGTTASGYYALEKNNTRFSIMNALHETCKKAKNK
jgi:pyrroline-5-carboxylate reductase